MMTTVDLLRHGEVAGGSCYRGTTDDPLTELGWQQMREAVAERDDWQLIISSPLCRCLNFAEEISVQKQRPLLVEAGFQELHFGDWEGKTAEQIEQIQPNALKMFYQDPINYPPPNGESLLVFQQRIETAWQKMLKNQQGKSILIITHAGVMRTLFCLLLKIPLVHSFAIQVDHASFTRFSCFQDENGDFIQLNFHNCRKIGAT
jgi:alpha-ribazole phosphatase/probable phosphoglycerate mutase